MSTYAIFSVSKTGIWSMHAIIEFCGHLLTRIQTTSVNEYTVDLECEVENADALRIFLYTHHYTFKERTI